MVSKPTSTVEQPPETWVIGDVQGCLDSLLALLPQLPDHARVWLTGDLVNRGPRSLDTVRWAVEQGDRIVTVLGNHDLHLLAVAAGIRRAHRTDTVDDILAAPDRDALLDWVRSRPLAHFEGGWLMVHAGVLPQWSIERTLELADEVHRSLSGPKWLEFLHEMYGNEPAQWSDSLRGNDRLRVIVNALTRIRFCTPEGRMEFHAKEGTDSGPAGYLPWFDVPGRASAGTPIVFGHWAALGWLDRPDLLSIDTGCVWGRELTAVRLSDRATRSVECIEGSNGWSSAG